jgi:drug/metabolite transporter (DMT)-like permease
MKKIIIYIFISAILFSTMEVTLKIVSLGTDPFQITFIRFMIGGIFLLPFAISEIKKRKITLKRKDFIYMGGLGIVCICVSMIFFQFGVMKTSASTAAVIFCTNPMFTMIFAHFITDEKMSKKKVIAAGISILGLLTIINPFNISLGENLLGMTFSLSSAITFGLYSAMGKRRIERLGGLAQTSISFIMGATLLLVFLSIMGRPIISGIDQSNIIVILYVSIFITGFGYLFYFLAMEKSNASLASLVFFVKPGIAPIIAVIVLSETIALNTIIGILLIFIGSYLIMNKTDIKKVGKDYGN